MPDLLNSKHLEPIPNLRDQSLLTRQRPRQRTTALSAVLPMAYPGFMPLNNLQNYMPHN